MSDDTELVLYTVGRLLDMATDKEPLTIFRNKQNGVNISIGENTYTTCGYTVLPTEFIDAYAFIKAQRDIKTYKTPAAGKVIL